MARRRRRTTKKVMPASSNEIKDLKTSNMQLKNIANNQPSDSTSKDKKGSNVIASHVIHQTVSESVKSSSPEKISLLFQKNKHLLVPVNVQAFVVPEEHKTTSAMKQYRIAEQEQLDEIARLEHSVSDLKKSKKQIQRSMEALRKTAQTKPSMDNNTSSDKSKQKDTTRKQKSNSKNIQQRDKQMLQKLEGLQNELATNDAAIIKISSELKFAQQRLESIKASAPNEQIVPQNHNPGQHASLKTTHSQEEGESKVWGLPPPFQYESVANGGGLEPGIHLMWTLPQALLQGEANGEDSFIEDDAYLDLDGMVPDGLIPADGEERSITLREAIEQRIEFNRSTKDDETLSESLTFPQLPDRWLVVRQKNNGKASILESAWIVNSFTLEVHSLSDYIPSVQAKNSASMTGIGPYDGDFYWTATYDNVAGRFSFHDLPSGMGNYDYFVCGWYTNQNNDPAYMPSSSSEHEWFDRIENDLNWAINRLNIDNDPTIELNPEVMEWLAKYAQGLGVMN